MMTIPEEGTIMNRNFILLIAGALLALGLLGGCSNEDSDLTAAS